MNWALMSADFKLAKEMAGHYRTRPDGYMLGLDTNRYANALTLRNMRQPTLSLILAQHSNRWPGVEEAMLPGGGLKLQ